MLDYFMNLLNVALTNEEGQGMVEYVLIIALVAIAVIAAIGLMTGAIQNTFTTITNTL